jgi:hypothetical protein
MPSPSDRSRPAGQKKTSTEWKREVSVPPAGQITASRSEDKKKGPEGPSLGGRSDYTQPRSFIAVATRSIATMYAALRM